MQPFSFSMILLLHPSQGNYSINCSSLRHKAKLQFVNRHYSTKPFFLCILLSHCYVVVVVVVDLTPPTCCQQSPAPESCGSQQSLPPGGKERLHFPVGRECWCHLSIQVESSKATACRLHLSLPHCYVCTIIIINFIGFILIHIQCFIFMPLWFLYILCTLVHIYFFTDSVWIRIHYFLWAILLCKITHVLSVSHALQRLLKFDVWRTMQGFYAICNFHLNPQTDYQYLWNIWLNYWCYVQVYGKNTLGQCMDALENCVCGSLTDCSTTLFVVVSLIAVPHCLW